jgi:uroporphyrinogen decarboxylase
MSKKENMAAALERRQPKSGDVVPIWELEFHLWDKFSGRHVVVGREFEKLTAKEQEKALHSNAEIFNEVSEKLNFSAITVPGGYWEIAPGEPAYFWLPEKVRPEQIKIFHQMAPEVMLITGASGTLGIPEAANFEEFSIKLFTEPEEIDRLARKRLQDGVDATKRLVECGIDAVYSAADLADSRGPYYNPAQMERFVLPYLREWASQVKKAGAYAIQHSDGNLMPYIEKLADSGIDALQAIDPLAGMNMRKVKDLVGDRICLCGNVDCGLMVTGSAEQVFNATRDLLVTCKKGGGLVLGASNALQQEVPTENYLAMLDAWKKFGVY